jgi:hypothetical protein
VVWTVLKKLVAPSIKARQLITWETVGLVARSLLIIGYATSLVSRLTLP